MTASLALTIIFIIFSLLFILFMFGGKTPMVQKNATWAYIATVIAIALINLF